MDIAWLNFHLHHTPFKKKTIDGQAIESGALVANVSYFSLTIAHSRLYVTPIEGYIKTIISLRTVIKSDTSVSKINSTKKLTPCI